MLYKTNFLNNGISHANLVEASNIELAKSFFIKEHLDGDATRLVEIKENNESYKPGQPCWKVPDNCITNENGILQKIFTEKGWLQD